MKQRTVYLEIVVFLILAVACSAYVIKVVGGPAPLSGSYGVTMRMDNGAGIVVSSEVAYRGVTVGKVGAIAIDPDRSTVDVTLSLRRNISVPADVTAAVSQDTAAPVLKIELQSAASSGPYLSDGAVIAKDRTSVPVPLSTLIANFNGVADTFNPKDLDTITRELAAGLTGTAPQLTKLVDNFTVLVNTLAVNQPVLTNLLTNSRTVFEPNANGVADLPQIAASLRGITNQLRDADPDIRKLLDQTPAILANQVVPLLANNQQSVSVLLANSVVSSQIVAARMPAVNALLVAVPDGFNKLASVVHDGRAQLDLITALGPVCFYDTPRRPVEDTSPRPLDPNQHCADTSGQVQVRGSQNVPRPPAGGQSQVGLTSYDPTTGITGAGDGSTARIGVGGGQQQILGTNSFAALLLQGTQ